MALAAIECLSDACHVQRYRHRGCLSRSVGARLARDPLGQRSCPRVWLDTSSTSSPRVPGKGYKSAMLTRGRTYYFDQERSVTGSVLFRYERHGRKASGVRPGNQLSMEWGIGKNLRAVFAGRGGLQPMAIGQRPWCAGGSRQFPTPCCRLGGELPGCGGRSLSEGCVLKGVQRPR